MSTTEPGLHDESPFAPVPGPDDPSRGVEVLGPVDGPFEAPAKEFVPGPYYKGVEERMPELAPRPEADRPPQPAPIPPILGKAGGQAIPVDRRDFMKLFGVAATAATSACVQRPVEHVVPYVNQPVDQWPGEPVYYATTCGECAAGCGVMVRTREGRPTKIEGLPDHPLSAGRMCATGQATLQGLFHPDRQKKPLVRFNNVHAEVEWRQLFDNLAAHVTKSQKIGILTTGSTGHRHQFFREFLDKIGSSGNRLYAYDSNSLADGIVAAHQIAYGVAAMPRVDLQAAKLIVGIGADFLDIGTSLLYQTRGYTEAHAFKGTKEKGRHVQLEAALTLTGARADERYVIPPGTETLATLLLVKALLKNARSKGSASARSQIQQVLDQKSDLLGAGYQRLGVTAEAFDKLAGDLLAGPPAVVLSGGSASFDENATNLQLAAIMANELIGAYDAVLQLQKGWMPAATTPGDLKRFLAEAKDLDVLFIIDQDPVFNLPPSFGVQELLKRVPTVVMIADYPTETGLIASHRLNAHHYLESWGDEQPVAGLWSVRQPAVRPTTDSRQTEDILMWVAAAAKKPLGYEDYRAYLKKRWSEIRTANGRTNVPEEMYFEVVLQQGFDVNLQTQTVGALQPGLAANFKYVDSGAGGLRLICPLDFRLRDGRHAWKPALQETPDSLTTVTWDTWVAMNPSTAAKYGFRKFDVLRIEGPGGAFNASLFPLPGLHPDAVVVPRGNGHQGLGLIESNNGVNPLIALGRAEDAHMGSAVTAGQMVKLTATGQVFQCAQLQKHDDIANRIDIIKAVSLDTAVANVGKTHDLDDVPDIFPPLPRREHRWGMSIDLTKCTGCGSCVTACFIENNVPQVGREQVILGRGMHWIKIDRYFAGPTDNPTVTMQPMLCQHCMHAPCEAVCPVFATTHDPEGINTMTYNRCIGTKYCANACPYKIRRFNWWTHKWNVTGRRLVDRNPRALNPDVTVRTRGVMEKCNFCYQRVRQGRHKEKLAGIRVGEPGNVVKTACQQTCPADAITFGNLLNPGGEVAQLRRDKRAFLVLGGDPDKGEYGLKTLPNVSYLAKVTLGEPLPGEGGEGAESGERKGGEHRDAHEGA